MGNALRSTVRTPERGNSRAPVRFNGLSLISEALVDLNEDGIEVTAGAVSAWLNKGRAAAAYDLDVVVGTGANLKLSIHNAMLLYGASGDFASSPDSAAASVTGSIDLRGEATLDDWTSGASQEFIVKWTAGGSQRSYRAINTGSGTLQLALSVDGIATVLATAIAHGFTDGEVGRWRMTWDQASKDVKYYTRSDGDISSNDGWTQVGATQTLNVASIFDSTALIEIGSVNAGTQNLAEGSISRAQIYDGIDGTLAVDFNAADYVNRSSDTVFTSANTGEVWTLNGNTFIQNTGNDVVHSIGGAGLETTSGQDIATPMTVMMVFRSSEANPAANQNFTNARSDNAKSLNLQTLTGSSDKFSVDAGAALILTEAYDTDAHLWTVQHNADSSSKSTVSDVGEKTGTIGTEVWAFGTVFANASAGLTAAGYIGQLLVWDRALTEDEISAVQSFVLADNNL